MKRFKRNAVIVTVLVFVAAAVYLNWSYDNRTRDAMELGAEEPAAVEPAAVEKTEEAPVTAENTAAVTETADPMGLTTRPPGVRRHALTSILPPCVWNARPPGTRPPPRWRPWR